MHPSLPVGRNRDNNYLAEEVLGLIENHRPPSV